MRAHLKAALVIGLESAMAIALSLAMHAQEKPIEFTLLVRDSSTQFAVPAEFVLTPIQEQKDKIVSQADGTGSVRLSAPPGDYTVSVSKVGYTPMTSRISVARENKGKTLVTYMLVPDTPPPELAPSILESKVKPGRLLIVGFVSDAHSGVPLKDARFSLVHAGVEVKTNSRGYFEVSVLTPSNAEGQFGYCDDLRFEHEGYTSTIYENEFLGHSDYVGISPTLGRGEGTQRIDATHKLMRGTECPTVPKQ